MDQPMKRTEEYYPSIKYRKLVAQGPILLAGLAYLLATVGFGLSLAGLYDYHAGNLIIFGGLCLMFALTWYQFAEKKRLR